MYHGQIQPMPPTLLTFVNGYTKHSIYQTPYVASKAEHIYFLAFYRKSLLTSGFDYLYGPFKPWHFSILILLGFLESQSTSLHINISKSETISQT